MCSITCYAFIASDSPSVCKRCAGNAWSIVETLARADIVRCACNGFNCWMGGNGNIIGSCAARVVRDSTIVTATPIDTLYGQVELGMEQTLDDGTKLIEIDGIAQDGTILTYSVYFNFAGGTSAIIDPQGKTIALGGSTEKILRSSPMR